MCNLIRFRLQLKYILKQMWVGRNSYSFKQMRPYWVNNIYIYEDLGNTVVTRRISHCSKISYITKSNIITYEYCPLWNISNVNETWIYRNIHKPFKLSFLMAKMNINILPGPEKQSNRDVENLLLNFTRMLAHLVFPIR